MGRPMSRTENCEVEGGGQGDLLSTVSQYCGRRLLWTPANEEIDSRQFLKRDNRRCEPSSQPSITVIALFFFLMPSLSLSLSLVGSFCFIYLLFCACVSFFIWPSWYFSLSLSLSSSSSPFCLSFVLSLFPSSFNRCQGLTRTLRPDRPKTKWPIGPFGHPDPDAVFFSFDFIRFFYAKTEKKQYRPRLLGSRLPDRDDEFHSS